MYHSLAGTIYEIIAFALGLGLLNPFYLCLPVAHIYDIPKSKPGREAVCRFVGNILETNKYFFYTFLVFGLHT